MDDEENAHLFLILDLLLVLLGLRNELPLKIFLLLALSSLSSSFDLLVLTIGMSRRNIMSER